jgi:hypothetical protein
VVFKTKKKENKKFFFFFMFRFFYAVTGIMFFMTLSIAFWSYYKKNSREVSFRKSKLFVNVFIFLFGVPNFSDKFIFGTPDELTCYEKLYSIEAIAYVSAGMVVGEELFSLFTEPANTLDIMAHHVSDILLRKKANQFFFSIESLIKRHLPFSVLTVIRPPPVL